MKTKTYISVVYNEDSEGRFRAFVKGCPTVVVEGAEDFIEARLFIKILFREEIGECKIIQEFINYYYEGT